MIAPGCAKGDGLSTVEVCRHEEKLGAKFAKIVAASWRREELSKKRDCNQVFINRPGLSLTLGKRN